MAQKPKVELGGKIKALKVSNEIDNLNGDSVSKEVKPLLQKYSSVFQPGIGKLKEFTTQFSLKEKSQPRYMKHRNVPYPLREKVDKELECLEKYDIYIHWNQ